jgi:LPS sulfotransferase NodH
MVEYATTPNGVLSAKIHWRHMAFLRALLGDGTPGGEELPRDALLRLAPRLDFCWVSRRNKVRQAVSLLRARAGSGFLWRGDTSRPPARDIEFDTAAIRRLVEEIEEGEAHWGEWFRQREIVPCRVWYEDDLEHDFAQTVLRLLGRLAIDAPPDLVVRSNLRKQSDELSEQLVQQYLQASRA